jgi:hypothetical protein
MCGLASVATFKTALATVVTARRVLRRAVLALVAVLPVLTTPPATRAAHLPRRTILQRGRRALV